PFGEPLFVCSSAVTGDDLVARERTGELVCEIPRLPLLAGRYSVSLYVEAKRTLADKVLNAAYFDVFDTDVFGTGRLPPTSHGRVVVEHAWHVADGSK